MIYADYFDKFKCKCGDCRHVCCGGWGITVSDEEYFRLLGLDCPDGLRYILDCALAPVDDPCPERYAMMKPSYEGKCRLLDETGSAPYRAFCPRSAARIRAPSPKNAPAVRRAAKRRSNFSCGANLFRFPLPCPSRFRLTQPPCRTEARRLPKGFRTS